MNKTELTKLAKSVELPKGGFGGGKYYDVHVGMEES